MIETAQSPTGRTGIEQQRARSRRLGLALLLFTLGIVITCVRFPPADVTGWIAQTLGVPLGIPFLLAALLFSGAAWVLQKSNARHRVLLLISLIAAAVSAVIGVSTITTFVS